MNPLLSLTDEEIDVLRLEVRLRERKPARVGRQALAG